MSVFTFKRGGVHPPGNKELSSDKKVEQMSAPETVYIPLMQHIGAPAKAVIKVGDKVKKGQLIGEKQGFVSSNIHSSVSGEVIDIKSMAYPINKEVTTVIIQNDGEDNWVDLNEHKDYKNIKKEELLEIIDKQGIVGKGGATFPTSIKLDPPKDKPIDTLLLNGAECEPYLNADNRLMIDRTDEMIEGIKIILHILGINNAIIGIEDNKQEAIKVVKNAIKDESDIELAVVETKYPQGGEKQLIKAVLDREVPSGCLPSEIGVVVHNVATARAIYQAVVEGKPLIRRIVTVTGGAIKDPKNLCVSIGTRFKDVLDYVGFDKSKMEKLILGGPMMGFSQYTWDVSVIKGTSGILALTKEESKSKKTYSCINCGKCIEACPVNLLPQMYAKLGVSEQWKEMEDYNLMDCMECGSCSYICPSNRPITDMIKLGKLKLRSKK
ncbi:MAG: electron transport complex subunit RsxC [Fusobacteriota bacterium]